MNVIWLQSFVTFAQSSSLEQAALKLGVTQPTLTRQLMSLEEELGVSLFTMNGRRKVLTSMGEDLFRELQPRFEGIESSVRRSLLRSEEPDRITIRIGARREIIHRYAKRIKFSGHLIYELIGNDEIVSKLLQRTIDIGISHELPDSHHISYTPIFDDHLTLCIPPGWNLKEKLFNQLILNLLESKPMLSYSEQNLIVEQTFNRLHIPLNKLQASRTCSDWIIILDMISSGMGWALVPNLIAKERKDVRIIDLPLDLRTKSQFYLIYLTELKGYSWFQEIQKTRW